VAVVVSGPDTREDNLIILMPVFNDWETVSLILPALDRELTNGGLRAQVLIVNDGSMTPAPSGLGSISFTAIASIDVLVLRRNLGHQRAIAVGLAFVEANRQCQAVVVMDSDGEDDPRDVPRLVRECIAAENQKIIFAERTRRSENLIFRMLYHLYRLGYFLLTGIHVRVGNFSVIPAGMLPRLVAVSELWNHYAAATYKARLPIALLPTRRSLRLAGHSRMNFVALVVHGLSAMAVFGDRIGVRLLIVVAIAMGLAIGALIAVVCIRLFTSLAVPGWATYVSGFLLMMLIQMFFVILAFAFMILAARDTASIIPSRDYIYLTGGLEQIYGKGQ